MTPALVISRAQEGVAELSGPVADVHRIAAASGVEARECSDARLRKIVVTGHHEAEDALEALAVAAGYAAPPRTCTLCDAARRRCVVHRVCSCGRRVGEGHPDGCGRVWE